MSKSDLGRSGSGHIGKGALKLTRLFLESIWDKVWKCFWFAEWASGSGKRSGINAQRETDWPCIMAIMSRGDIWALVTWRDRRLFQRSTRLMRGGAEVKVKGRA